MSAIPDAIARLAAKVLDAPVAGVEALEGGLGSRLFFRVTMAQAEGRPATAIARVELPEDPALRPQGVPPEPPLEPLRAFLETNGLPVPRCYGIDADAEILLLEDAGPESLQQAAALDSPDERRALYTEACGWLPRLQALSAPPSEIAAFGRRLDGPLFRYKAEQFVEWAAPWALGRAVRPAEAEAVRDAFALVCEEALAAPARLSHRDYKAANLHVLPTPRPDGGRLLWIDLQGAFLAPPEYDLVCLLRDSQVALPEPEVEDALARVRAALPDAPSPEVFDRRFTLLTLTRNGKDLSRFLYAAHQRGDRRYLAWLPHAAATLRRAAAHAAGWDPRLERLADLIAQLPETPRSEPVTRVTDPQQGSSETQDARDGGSE